MNIFKWLIFSLFMFLLSCDKSKTSELIRLRGRVFGTNYSITYKDKVNYKSSIDSVFNKFDLSLNTYIPNSIVSKVNRNEAVTLDPFFIEAFQKARHIYQETDGFFDPTIGALVSAYGFGTDRAYKKISDKELERFRKVIGLKYINISNNEVTKLYPEVQFDVNAFGKGFGIDVVGRFLESKNIINYLIEVGGEIRARGTKEGKAWKIGIENPNTNGSQSLNSVVLLKDKSMATSGNYRKYRVDSNGKKFVHIINPKTCLAEESNLLSASVIADGDCADVDAYATAFMVMGLEKTKAFLVNHSHLKVILIYFDDKGTLVVYKN